MKGRKRLIYSMMIVFSVQLSLLLAACSGSGIDLNEKEETICEMISSSIYFSDKESINVISGTVFLSSDEDLFDTRAYLTISYVDSAGNNTTGNFAINGYIASDINQSDEEITTVARHIELSERVDDDIDYNKINAELNK